MRNYIRNLNIPHRARSLGSVALFFLLCRISLTAQVTNSRPGDYREEIYLQTDRDVYIAGEEVYFKIIELGSLTRQTGSISKVVYVDMSDGLGNPLVQLKIETDGRTGAGSFRIPDTLRTGNYFIRSFTNWMRNYSPLLFAYRKISVINPFESVSRIRLPDADTRADSVVFYPETGCLVEGVNNRLGIRCFNKTGDPVSENGVIVTSESDTLGRFRADKNGFAVVMLKPEGSGELHLITTNNMLTGRKFKLPPISEEGLTFTLNNDREAGLLTATLRKNKALSMTGRKMSIIYYPLSFAPASKELSGSDTVVSFSQDNLPAGLAKIIIRDDKGKVLASRWYFNEKNQGIPFDVAVEPGICPTRSKVSIDIAAEDGSGEGMEYDLQVSVVRSGLSKNSRYHDLIRGIQYPALQASDNQLEFSDINDYLLFYINETDIPGNENTSYLPAYLPEPEGHLISGIIRDRITGAPLKNETISLSFVGKTARCSFTRTDENGEFNFPTREYGIREVVIQPLFQISEGYYLDLKDHFLIEGESFYPELLYIDSTCIESIDKAIVAMQVRDIYSQFLQVPAFNSKVNGRPDFYGEPDRTIFLSDYIELTTLREVFREIVPGTSTFSKNGRISFRLINKFPDAPFTTPPLALLDGVPVYDIEKVLDMQASAVEKIEILNTRYFISDIIIEGIINIVSKKGDLSDIEFNRSVFRQEFNGLHEYHGFLSPVYSADSLKSSRIPDFRNTLYWNPGISTDKSGKASVEFYTSDETGEFRVSVEGFTSDGRRGWGTASFVVR